MIDPKKPINAARELRRICEANGIAYDAAFMDRMEKFCDEAIDEVEAKKEQDMIRHHFTAGAPKFLS